MESQDVEDCKISLNISSEPISKKFKPNKKNKKKKQINQDSSDVKDVTLNVNESSIKEISKKKKRDKDFTNNTQVGKSSRKGEKKSLPVSSLFKSNPDIPELVIPNAELKQESLFSDKSFGDLSLHPHLVSCLQSRFEIKELTEVQEKTIPVLLNGKDALVKSCTGSGKTLAYAVPIVQKLQAINPKIRRSDGVFAVILLPTRELALQSYACFSKLTQAFTWIVPGFLIGGEKKKSEKARIRKGINILVSTPGRLLDHLQHTCNLSLKNINWFVIDEADRLLEQGFEEAVLKIFSSCQENSNQRQTVLLSATLTKAVEKLAGMSLVHPEYIDISTSAKSEKMTNVAIPSQLQQYFVITPTKLRLVTLSAFLIDKSALGSFKALIFMCSQNVVEFHFLLFDSILKPMLEHDERSMKFFKLHGNMQQEERTETFNKFRTVEDGILICTDVAARGLDLQDVDWIIQYNTPTSAENYVHRVGRTARIGKKGSSVMFLVPSELKLLHLLQEQGICMEKMDMDKILSTLLKVSNFLFGKRKKPAPVDEHATTLHMKFEQLVYAEPAVHKAAKDAFLSFAQAYSCSPKQLKLVLPFKSLHLGHVAKSFCLRESPSELGCHHSAPRYKNQRQDSAKVQKNRLLKRKAPVVISEYGSGFDKSSTQKKRLKRN